MQHLKLHRSAWLPRGSPWRAYLRVAPWECGYFSSKLCYQGGPFPFAEGELTHSTALWGLSPGHTNVLWAVREVSGAGIWHFLRPSACALEVMFLPQPTFLKMVVFFKMRLATDIVFSLGSSITLNCSLPRTKFLISFTSSLPCLFVFFFWKITWTTGSRDWKLETSFQAEGTWTSMAPAVLASPDDGDDD